ncbi:hypothetical protein GBF38_021149, partial [Nibea albiflora]
TGHRDYVQVLDSLRGRHRDYVQVLDSLRGRHRDYVQVLDSLRGRHRDYVQVLDSLRGRHRDYVQKQQCEQLDESLQKAQNALQSCDHQLTELRAESEAVLGQLISWQRLRDELQVYVSAVQEVMQINLLSFNQSELCVELRPRPSSDQATNELDPLKLSITWSQDEHFSLQVSGAAAGLVEDCVSGRCSELSAALLDVMQCYMGQFQLLSEIQGLRASFAIDWRPAQRLLVYLKTAVLVCHLEVEDGYPSAGRARLLSVRRDGQPLDTRGLKVRHGDT